ncbi:MAG: tRNA (guanine-N1)-methyltransferase [Archaeoglobaceae archaeon]
MRLREFFVEKLSSLGIERIGTRIKEIVYSRDPIKAMALEVANGRAYVLKGSANLNYSFTLDGKIVREKPQAYVDKEGEVLFGKEIFEMGNFPYIAIDCRFYDLHSEKERSKLRLQVTQTLGVIREFMWDGRLIVAGKDFGVGVYCEKLEEFLLNRGINEVVLLDPKGDELFKKGDARCYVIGGIVDKGENRYLTGAIGDELEKAGIKCERQRIELRGDIVGVSDRINHIAEIVLKVVLDDVGVEEAVREVQPRVVAKWRLRKELPKKSVRLRVGDKTVRVVSKSVFKDFDWLNLQKSDFYDVCREQRLYLVSEKVMEEIKKLPWDEKKRFYTRNLSASFENSSTTLSSPSK